MSEKLIAVQHVTLARAETGTMGIGRELGSDQITLHWNNQSRTLGRVDGERDELIEFPAGNLTVNGRFTYTWSGRGTVTYRKRSQPTRVHGAPGGYGHVQDELAVRHIRTRQVFSPGQVIAEGQLHVRLKPSRSDSQ